MSRIATSSVTPLLRPGELFDRQLVDADRTLFFGQDPSDLLHAVLGTGISTHVLSTVYVAFVFILPVMLAVALVFSPDLRGGLFLATALSINWITGLATYIALPARGPIYFEPADFADLPATHASYLRGGCSTSGGSSSPTPPRRAPRRTSRRLRRCTARCC